MPDWYRERGEAKGWCLQPWTEFDSDSDSVVLEEDHVSSSSVSDHTPNTCAPLEKSVLCKGRACTPLPVASPGSVVYGASPEVWWSPVKCRGDVEHQVAVLVCCYGKECVMLSVTQTRTCSNSVCRKIYHLRCALHNAATFCPVRTEALDSVFQDFCGVCGE